LKCEDEEFANGRRAVRLVLPKFGSVRFSPPFLRTENRTDRFFSELNRTGTEPFRTGSNGRTARNFEKTAPHKFYILKLIVTCNLCLNFFVLILFEGTSARKHEIDTGLPYLVMTNHSKLRKPGQSWLCFGEWGVLLPFYITHKLFYTLFFVFQVKILTSSQTVREFWKILRTENRTAAKTGEPEPDWTELSVRFCRFWFSASVLNWTSATLRRVELENHKGQEQCEKIAELGRWQIYSELKTCSVKGWVNIRGARLCIRKITCHWTGWSQPVQSFQLAGTWTGPMLTCPNPARVLAEKNTGTSHSH